MLTPGVDVLAVVEQHVHDRSARGGLPRRVSACISACIRACIRLQATEEMINPVHSTYIAISLVAPRDLLPRGRSGTEEMIQPCLSYVHATSLVAQPVVAEVARARPKR